VIGSTDLPIHLSNALIGYTFTGLDLLFGG